MNEDCGPESLLDKCFANGKLAGMLKKYACICMFIGSLLQPSFTGATPLHQAVRASDLATIREILETSIGTALDLAPRDGITAIHLAAATDQHDVIRLLIERGAAVDSRTSRGFTPLHWAASRNAIDSMAVLIAAGADPDARAMHDITPLHWAAAKDAMLSVQMLIEAGSNPQARTAMGETPLHLAVKNDPNSESAILLAQSSLADPVQLRLERTEEPQPPTPTPQLPEAAESMIAARPGMFLSVPIGVGQALNFVWIEPLQIWFGKYEITNGEYRRFQPAHTSRQIEGFSLNGDEQPVVFVSWQDAEAFTAWLNLHFRSRIPEGYTFRLPTEAEWMYAASTGDNRTYPWGDEWPPLYGNFSDQTARRSLSHWQGIEGYDDGYAVTAPVQNSGMNELGIFGLAGNVWEWTLDWLDPEEQIFKIRKGGSWDFDPRESLRIRARGLDRPTARYETIGFRIVVAPPAP